MAPCTATSECSTSGRSTQRLSSSFSVTPGRRSLEFSSRQYNFCGRQTSSARSRTLPRKHSTQVVASADAVSEILNFATQGLKQLQHIGSDLISVAPNPIRAVLQQLGADLSGVIDQRPTTPGVLRLLLIYYGFFTKPSPAFGIVDFYILNPLDNLLRKGYKVEDLTLRERLGGGNYGQVFEGVRNKNGSKIPVTRELTREEKRRRLVLKRVNRDNMGTRSDFLRAGTIAQGAGETGLAEGYMCSRIMRDPVARRSAAEYLGNFTADQSEGGFTAGTQWLVWKFESDSTLAYASSVRTTPLVLVQHSKG